jgi:DUF971 family protein
MTQENFATDAHGTQHWPTEVRYKRAERALVISFDNGARATLPAEYLRVESPSAEVQGHSPDQKQTVPGKRSVAVAELEPIGNYAVRLIFDDGHDTGIFSWKYLYELGMEYDERWARYLSALEAQGLNRDTAPHRHGPSCGSGGGGCG